MASPTQPLVLAVEEPTWRECVDRCVEWLETATLLQATFRKMLEDTINDVAEPHIREWLDDMIVAARRHEGLINELYVGFSRDRLPPSEARASVLARMRDVVADVESRAARAPCGAWRKLRELMLTNVDSTTGFAVIEQLARAMGLPAVVNLVLPVIHEKTKHQMVLRECLLETAPKAILYPGDG